MSNITCSITAHATPHSQSRLRTNALNDGVLIHLLISVGNTVDTPVSTRRVETAKKSYHNASCTPTPRAQGETLALIKFQYELLSNDEKLRVDGTMRMATSDDQCRIAPHYTNASTRPTKPRFAFPATQHIHSMLDPLERRDSRHFLDHECRSLTSSQAPTPRACE